MKFIQPNLKFSYELSKQRLNYNTLCLFEYHTHERVLFRMFHSLKTFRFSILL